MSKVFHIRRCHVCGETNQLSSASIQRCSCCGKHLAPFYYFDESKLEGLSVEQPFLSLGHRSSRNYLPIWGLSTYWYEDDESAAV